MAQVGENLIACGGVYVKNDVETLNEDWFAECISFLLSHQWIYNFPVTRFFVDRVWEHVPDEWRSFLLALTVEELNALPYGQIKKEWPASFCTFIRTAMKSSIEREGNSAVAPVEVDKDLQRGMKPKKVHEVSLMAACIHDVMDRQDIQTVVDVGAGLGYLGQVLQRLYGYKVISLECDLSRTHGAEKRVRKQAHAAEHQQISLTFDLKDDPEVMAEFGHAIEAHVEGSMCMVGLHCCGDLTPTMLRYFAHLDQLSILCTVGCCYHRMATLGQQGGEGNRRNFPMSRKCQDAFTEVTKSHPTIKSLSTHALRLAAQETRGRWRDQTAEQHNFHQCNVAYRGLLELLYQQDELAVRKLTRRISCKRDYKNFDDYLDAILPRLHLETKNGRCPEHVDHTREHLHQLYLQNEEFFSYIEPITALQVVLQPVLETLLYYDRLSYLQEQGIQAQIVPLFDECISPRNLLLIGIKQHR